MTSRVPAGFAALATMVLAARAGFAAPGEPPGLTTNDAFVSGLYTNLNLDDPIDVFRFVFENLPDEVTIFPSEGYYYFEFPARGLLVTGSLALFARSRDAGEASFGYVSRVAGPTKEYPSYGAGGSLTLTRAEGFELVCESEWRYRAGYRGKTVTFRLQDPGLVPPDPARLHEDEEYVASSFDESGLRFHLLFHGRAGRLYWMLADEGFVPEVLAIVSPNLARGERTKFVFFLDRELDRRILVGVYGEEVRWNSWYDGPFDQLPDTHVKAGRVAIRPYLETQYRLERGEIDDFGYYTGREGVRVPVAPYLVYEDLDELSFIDDCVADGLPGSKLYPRITEQVYTHFKSSEPRPRP